MVSSRPVKRCTRIKIDPAHPAEDAIIAAGDVLRAGGILIFPTDTMYGFSANPFRRSAIEKVQELKGRADSSRLLFLASDSESAQLFMVAPDSRISAVMKMCWPGAVSLITRAAPGLPGYLSAGGSTVGIRVTSTEPSLSICRAFGFPVVSTSVNKTGEPPIEDPDRIWEKFGSSVDLMLDCGRLEHNAPSTILDLTVDPPKIIRQGAYPAKILEKILDHSKP